MTLKRLVLFDIDGTLLRGGRFWRESYEGAVRKFLGVPEIPELEFNGKTDPQICGEILHHFDVPAGEHPRLTSAILDEYLTRAEAGWEEILGGIRVLPGVRDLLERLHAERSVLLGVLTGNVRRGADLKLRAAGLDGFFRLGAWGDDHPERPRLPAFAVERARAGWGVEFAGKDVVIIGDTVHDVNCGKSMGVTAIAVGTGWNVCQDTLKAQGPDHYFADLSDTAAVAQAVME
ncbi:MAG TPA: HAD family hydrolase [Bdellovibrionota bacterium]|nr:HAD family hydrolase [Bdellovibrionota bacterium]